MYSKFPTHNELRTTDVVIQQHNRKLLMMDILMSETCWARKKWNIITSDIKLVFYALTITMVHGPINSRCTTIFYVLDIEGTSIVVCHEYTARSNTSFFFFTVEMLGLNATKPVIVTQSANQHMHTFNFLLIKTYLKFLTTLLHVSVIRPSSRRL